MSHDLPEKTAKILSKIRRKYKVSLDPFKVRDISLDILQVNDIEPLLAGKDPFKDVASFPFWARLWEASIILADSIASTTPVENQTLLELGAGLGAPGLVAAAKGYKVTLSDYETHILDFQKVSAHANNLNDISFKIIDWKKPPKMARFDTIIGAEILFRDEFFQPLLNVFSQYLKPDGTIFLAHDVRRKSLARFLSLAEQDFTIATQSRKLKFDDEERTIILNRLQPRT
ncbi:MAG: methyltransferase domain-containing protein [Proteobacteria bacterium]|nr:methyltransferase domain-containing protein [Pseudomonadota bacterium]MBU1711185.1 methyltransferase domain-containing protein [Pseudomonadota bacterium]